MNDIEQAKCDFCGEIKPVRRHYVRVANKHFDDNKKGSYSNYFSYCDDCGIETTMNQETKQSVKEALASVVNNPELIKQAAIEGAADQNSMLTKQSVDEIVAKLQKIAKGKTTPEFTFRDSLIEWAVTEALQTQATLHARETELQKAEQQILGFYHCYNGYDLTTLINAMGLTRTEFEQMMRQGMLDYLPEELGTEIVKALTPSNNNL